MMDMPSFVNYFLINELTRNVDGFRLSTYFYKDKDSKGGKLTMGPTWDYNLSFGNADYYDGYLPQGWAYNKLEMSEQGRADYVQTPFWWGKLLRDSVFVNSLKSRWTSLRKTSLTPQNIFKFMDSTTLALKEPMQRNFGRFPLYGKKVWPNYYVGNNANDELYWMQNWITARIAWLDGTIKLLDASLVLSNTEPLEIKCYPNPTRQSVRLDFPLGQDSKVFMELYDSMGRRVRQQDLGNLSAGQQRIEIDLSAESAGRYIIHLSDPSQTIYRFQVVKSLE
jgi:hypothetical protein